MVFKFLATPVRARDIVLEPGGVYNVTLPESSYVKQGYRHFGFAGALMVWQGGIDVTISGLFQPVQGHNALLQFDAKDLVTASQFFTYPDPVFPVFQQGSNFNAVKWSPVNDYQFSTLSIQITNNNPTPITIVELFIIYYVYTQAEQGLTPALATLRGDISALYANSK